MAIFSIEDLNFSYPTTPDQHPLEHVSLQVEAGEYLALCGKSGSGKTTLLRHLKSVLTPYGKRTGRILFHGRPLEQTDRREQAAKIGFVMQDPDSQLVTDKVWHELAFGLENLGCEQNLMRTRVAEMACYFGIQDWFHRDVATLSGGQKQLLNLASIMAMQPEVLILDEPTSQLDPIAAADFLATLRKINQELGTTVILSEHRLEDVLHDADRVAVMEGGHLLALDTPHRVGYRLWASHSEMFSAMPAPVQVYYGAGGRDDQCPLTVREGRRWLSTRFLSPRYRELPPEPEFAEPQKPVLEGRELWFRYEKNTPDILRGVNLSVAPGTIFAIVGGNGTGKSTLLKAICGICKPYRGKLLLDGKAIDRFKSATLFRGNLAMLPQDPQSLFVKKTVEEDLLEMCDDPNQLQVIAATCQIRELLSRHPYDLSGGELQRAALAKVLLTQPRVLLLDEPTKGMDSFFKAKFAGILKSLKAQGTAIVLVSHDVEFCAAYADAVSMFFDGQILSTNTPRRFFAGNSFYTTAADRMSRHIFSGAVTAENVIALCVRNQEAAHEG